ncbi:hypothetical protein [Streptomyces tubercidicus]|uniref:hypothetical protein n=1 Tax=Streptomyces tubercidicus TaxID=47759 RepID=UPI00368FF37D
MSNPHAIAKVARDTDLYIYWDSHEGVFRAVMTRDELLSSTPVTKADLELADLCGSSVTDESEEGQWMSYGIYMHLPHTDPDEDLKKLARQDFQRFADLIKSGDQEGAENLLGREVDDMPRNAVKRVTRLLAKNGMEILQASTLTHAIFAVCAEELADTFARRTDDTEDGITSSAQAAQLLREIKEIFEREHSAMTEVLTPIRPETGEKN